MSSYLRALPPVSTFFVDLPYKWSTSEHTLEECLEADLSAFKLEVDGSPRGKTAEGWPVYRFTSTNYFHLCHFRDACCKALGWPSHQWRVIEREVVR